MTQRRDRSKRTTPFADSARIVAGLLFLVMGWIKMMMFARVQDDAVHVWEPSFVTDQGAMMLDTFSNYLPLIILLLIAYEWLVSALMLYKGKFVQVGLLGGIGFLILTLPFVGWYALPNMLLALVLASLLKQRYRRTSLEILARVRRHSYRDES